MNQTHRDHPHAGDPQGLRHRQGQGRSAQGHRPRRRPGRVRRHRRAVRLRQVDADEPHRLPRHADRRHLRARRRGRRRSSRATSSPRSATAASASSSRASTCCRRSRAFENVELPLLFGGVAPKKRRERVEELLDARRPRRPHGPQADRALRRPDAARRHRPRPGHEPRHRPRRRAHRQPRHLRRRRHHGSSSTSSGSRAARWSSSRTTRRSPAAPSRIVEIRDGRIVRDGEAAA